VGGGLCLQRTAQEHMCENTAWKVSAWGLEDACLPACELAQTKNAHRCLLLPPRPHLPAITARLPHIGGTCEAGGGQQDGSRKRPRPFLEQHGGKQGTWRPILTNLCCSAAPSFSKRGTGQVEACACALGNTSNDQRSRREFPSFLSDLQFQR